MRGAKKKGVRYFGPYAHAYAIRETLDMLLRTFPVRHHEDARTLAHHHRTVLVERVDAQRLARRTPLHRTAGVQALRVDVGAGDRSQSVRFHTEPRADGVRVPLFTTAATASIMVPRSIPCCEANGVLRSRSLSSA